MQFKYRFTVFTPCYNSEKFIHRVYESLCSQTFNDFEWLIIDDASADGTNQILRRYQEASDFTVRIYSNEQNQMISYNFNKAFDLAEGELFVIAGHDDRFDGNTLEIFNRIWKEYGNNEIAGIKCHCRNKEGQLIGKQFPSYVTVDNFFNLFADYIYRYEKFGCTRTEVLRQFKFDTSLMRYIPEGVMWGRIALSHDQIFLNETLRTYYIEDSNPNAFTKRGRLKAAESTRYEYLVYANEFLERIKGSYLLKARFHFAYLFHSFLFGLPPQKMIGDLNKLNSKLLCLILLTPAWVLSKVKQ